MMIMVANLFVFELSFGQINQPTNFPDRIILNPSAQPLNSFAFTWRTDTTIKNGFCEFQPATAYRIKPENSRIVPAKTSQVHYDFDNEPTIVCNQSMVILDSLKSGMKYIYRVGSGKSWSE